MSERKLWEHFYALTRIPRPSRHEEAALAYVENVGRQSGCEVTRDKGGNVILRCKATPGYENLTPVILQGHIDMVPQKEPGMQHDFLKDPIRTVEENGWVHAVGTTLGADNGIGVSAALAVISNPEVKHGPVEVLVTYDEETGMTGATKLQPGVLNGCLLFNMDSEQWGEICIGGAGGINVEAVFKGSRIPTAEEDIAIKVTLAGLKGGHSGMDINLGRANANKLMARFLKYAAANYESMLSEISGGNMRNAIPREATVVLTIDSEDKEDFFELVDEFEDMFRSEFQGVEPDLSFNAEVVDLPATVFDEMTADDLINALQGCPNGVVRMNADMPNLVETSSNMAIVQSEGNEIKVCFLVRSMVETEKEDLTSSIDSIMRLAGAEVTTSGDYPGWKPDLQSKSLAVVKEAFTKLYGEDPKVTAIHAGLECGIMAGAYPNWDMVSFGPTIRHPHSPAERVEVASVSKFWELLCEALLMVPKVS